jgi:hypothetical protein
LNVWRVIGIWQAQNHTCRIVSVKEKSMHASTDVAPNADDVAAIWNFRETLLAQNWPDSEAAGGIFGSNKDACAESKASRDRGREDNFIFGVWAGHDRGMISRCYRGYGRQASISSRA